MLEKKDYAYMVRTADLESNNFSDSVKYISKSTYDFLSKSKVYGGEVLINKIGSPGRTYLMPKLDIPTSLGMNLFLLRMKGNNIDENTLYLYLNSKIGKNIIQRKINGTVPLTIDKKAIKSLYVPIFSNEFRGKLNDYLVDSIYKEKESKLKYTQAEKFLVSELGFEDFKSSNEKVSVKSLKESFLKTGRLDSEYYQEKYDGLFEKLSKNKIEKLSNLVRIKKSIEPGSENYQTEGIPFIRVQDLSKFGLSTSNVFLSKSKFKDSITPRKDTILLSKDGSVGIAYKINKAKEVITSSAILHLEIKNENILPDYLTLVLNSMLVKMQAERDAGGSIINHWKKSEIENVIIPIIEKEKQEKISKLLIESENLRNESKLILEKAIKSIEIAIEYNEEKAINYLST
ncbi:hypothetical protein JMUB4039_1609 [Leptotrichia trevisanii]|uniref:hypothetical protein n=1 Tax=Leptotrichia trevisanii TaxID=109328 RepID=UPI00118AA656|nr:hypothetical protein [Leptotrichia trevisanii]BBM57629.1 hypothetical protein JMUB4039_1609 [Leptotrichia trevisanii]